jgi:hypothetical protein
MSNDKRKQAKKKQRERDIQHRRYAEQQRALRQAKLDEYPTIRLGEQDADPEFIKAVVEALKKIDFLDEKQIGASQQLFYKLGKRIGFYNAFRQLEAYLQEHMPQNNATLQIICLTLGAQILNLVPPEIRYRFMPYNDLTVSFKGRDIVLIFTSIRWKSGDGGRVYYSPLEPKVEFEGKQYTVGFSTHAIQRICKRIKPNYIEYGAAGDVHFFLRSCVYFEPVMLYGDQPAFVLYNPCENPSFAEYRVYTVEVFGEHNLDPPKGLPCYKVGYCPVVFEGGFAKAKTFIHPGFKSTPEYGLLKSSGLPTDIKERYLAKATDDTWTQSDIQMNSDNEIIKWFHDNGIPQVKQIKEKVVMYDFMGKKKRRLFNHVNDLGVNLEDYLEPDTTEGDM